jgi:hypothetical protein
MEESSMRVKMIMVMMDIDVVALKIKAMVEMGDPGRFPLWNTSGGEVCCTVVSVVASLCV